MILWVFELQYTNNLTKQFLLSSSVVTKTVFNRFLEEHSSRKSNENTYFRVNKNISLPTIYLLISKNLVFMNNLEQETSGPRRIQSIITQGS